MPTLEHTNTRYEKTSDLGDGVIKMILTVEQEDRDGEVVKVSGVDYQDYLSNNPVVLWAHDSWSLPVGKMLSIQQVFVAGKPALEGTIQLAINELPEAAQIYRLWQGGYINAGSMGFLPKQMEGNVIEACELVEFTICNIPANQGALRRAVDEGVLSSKQLSELVSKGAISSNLPTADKDLAWDASAALKAVKDWASDADGNIDFSKLSKAFFWVDPANKDKLGGYKLPFATIQDGKLVAVWRGVAAAYGALQGARGGVSIPDGDIAAVKSQIAKYYQKFDEEMPKQATEVETKAGAALSAANRQVIQDALDGVAKVDEIVDNLQETLSTILGVPNPDVDEPEPDADDQKQLKELVSINETLTELNASLQRSGAVASEDRKSVKHRKASTPPSRRSTSVTERRIRVVSVHRAAKAAQPALQRVIRITKASNTN